MEAAPQVLTFSTVTEDLPFRERVVLRNSIAFFESQPGDSNISADSKFLRSLPQINCGYGACDCRLHPFICVPDAPFISIPTAKTVLHELRASNFRSKYIESLDSVSIPYPGYNPGADNDEIHTEFAEQAIFRKPGEFDRGTEPSALTKDSIRWHDELKRYVLEGHLFYVLLHTKAYPHGEFVFSDWVVLFAVGVSPKTGNLVGAITHQACHNFCD